MEGFWEVKDETVDGVAGSRELPRGQDWSLHGLDDRDGCAQVITGPSRSNVLAVICIHPSRQPSLFRVRHDDGTDLDAAPSGHSSFRRGQTHATSLVLQPWSVPSMVIHPFLSSATALTSVVYAWLGLHAEGQSMFVVRSIRTSSIR